MMKKLRDKLCFFSGEDFSIIKRCDLKIQIYFSVIGGFVLAIFACCFISSFLLLKGLFNNHIIGLCIAGIWGLIVANLYLLTLYTIAPRLLPINTIKFPEKKYYLSISFLYRISVLIILATITARPINIAFQTNIIGSAFIISICIIIFLLPIIFKYYIRIIGGFYELKATIEKKMIEI